MSVFITTWWAWRLATSPRGGALIVWAVIIFARDVSVVAQTFTYPIFNSQSGMEFWLLNACIYTASLRSKSRIATAQRKSVNYKL